MDESENSRDGRRAGRCMRWGGVAEKLCSTELKRGIE